MSVVAVLDVGKTNVKLSIAQADGTLVETIAVENPTRPGPPYRHHDLAAIETWLLDGLRLLGRRHAIDAIVPCAHGSGGVLVGPDGPVMPMIDYETAPPPAIDADYRRIVGSYRERGSAIMLGAAHLARQMLWLETGWPDAFEAAHHFLALPQYWAWRLSGVAACEVTSLAAQSHLWSVADAAFAGLVARRGWERLLPPQAPAWATLGTLRPGIADRAGLSPAARVLTGIHDSTANLYRYQAAGLDAMTVVSTGTWLVALNDRPDTSSMTERPGLAWNSDVHGHPLAGVLMMAGREFSAIAGQRQPESAAVTPDLIAAILRAGTMALPSYGSDEGFFPGSAGRGRIEGPLPEDSAGRRALAVLTMALLTDAALDRLPPATRIVLDGSFVREPLYAALVAALRPEPVLVSEHGYGTATGAALLAGHESRTTPVRIGLAEPVPADPPDLSTYRAAWRERTRERSDG